MAPMIDLVFLLLVFFMCVSTLAEAERAVEVSLPEADKGRLRGEDEVLRWAVTVAEDGSLHLGAERVAVEALGERLRPGMRERPDAAVVVRADENTPFRETRKAMRAAAEAGAVDVRFGVVLAPPGGGQER